MTFPVHIEAKIDRTDTCWNWTGEKSSNGYGRAWYKGIRQSAHRLIWILSGGGPIEGRQLDHTCCNRACVNPVHLTPMSAKRNCQLREQRKKDGTIANI